MSSREGRIRTARLRREASEEHLKSGLITPLLTATAIIALTTIFAGEIIGRGQSTALSSPAGIVTFTLIIFCVLRLVGFALQREFSFVSSAFYLFVLVWMGLAPLAQIAFEHGPLGYGFDLDGYFDGALLTAAGVIGYEIGRRIARRRGRRHAAVTAGPRSINIRALSWLTCIGILVVVIAVFQVGGPALFLSSRSEFSGAVYGYGDSKATGGIVNAILLVVPFVLAFLWILAATSLKHLTVVQWALLIAANVLNLFCNNPLVQSRFWVATVGVSMISGLVVPVWKGFLRIATSLSLFALVVIFPFADVFRNADQSRVLQVTDPIAQLADKGDFDAFQQLVQTVAYVNENGLSWGNQVLASIGFVVPRTIWPGKAMDTGTLLGQSAGLGNVNLSEPLWGEGYVDFGIVGCIFYLGIFGYVICRIELAAIAHAAPLSVMGFLGVYQFVLLRGSLLQSMAVMVTLIVLVAVVWRRSAAPESSRIGTQ